MYKLTIVYEDGSQFLIGGFHNRDEAINWIREEKTRPYWKSSSKFILKHINNEDEAEEIY
jgi:hypothetical protein